MTTSPVPPSCMLPFSGTCVVSTDYNICFAKNQEREFGKKAGFSVHSLC